MEVQGQQEDKKKTIIKYKGYRMEKMKYRGGTEKKKKYKVCREDKKEVQRV